MKKHQEICGCAGGGVRVGENRPLFERCIETAEAASRRLGERLHLNEETNDEPDES